MKKKMAALVFSLFFISLTPPAAWPHCDTLDGPVAQDARLALQQGNVTPVLKWVKQADEKEVVQAFKQALAVRAKGKEAAEGADRYFLETAVRLHRASEGEPYTGLKPAGLDPGPAVRAADKALKKGSVDHLVEHLTGQVAHGLKARFQAASEAQKRAGASVQAGRDFVRAYVEFVHYAERLHKDATGGMPPHGAAACGHQAAPHEHK